MVKLNSFRIFNTTLCSTNLRPSDSASKRILAPLTFLRISQCDTSITAIAPLYRLVVVLWPVMAISAWNLQWRNKTRSKLITLLNWRQFRREKLPLFMPDQVLNLFCEHFLSSIKRIWLLGIFTEVLTGLSNKIR